MISEKTQGTPLRRIFESSMISAGVGVFIVAFITAIFLDYSSFRSERNRLHYTIHRTLAEFISPYLSISDTTEIRRMLRVVSKEGDVVGLITADSDIILADYTYSDLFQRLIGPVLPLRGRQLDCSMIQMKTLKMENQEYGVYCSELIADANGSGVKKISALMLSVYTYKFDRFIPHLFEYFLGIALVTLLILSFWVRRMLGHRVLNPMIRLRDAIYKKAADPLGGEAVLDPIGVSPLEVNQIKDAFERLIFNFRTEYQKRHLAHQKAALVDQATQIAHDIRSPLAALDLVVPSLQGLPEEERIMVRSAISRIKDIANNLLAQKRLDEVSSTEKFDQVFLADALKRDDIPKKTICLLSTQVEALVTEKRLQYRGSLGVSIEMDPHKNSYGVFAEVVAGEFNRILSNLIDNAIEALEPTKSGKVSISVTIENNNVVVSIGDNGKGIPEDILPLLAEKGRTFGKANGNGLGLYYARSLLEQWQGSLEIQSELGKGTSLRLILPRVETPEWFVSTISIFNQTTIVVLDDDQSIHQVWRMRFDDIIGRFPGVRLLHFNEPTSFLEWHSMVEDQNGFLFLLDYELLGHEITGLDLAERLKIENTSYLVSSRFEDISIRSRCEKSGIKLMPKSMAGFVPISAHFA